jgi:sterol desaturase/sphingolipid hydroxylase (fatty acid hydroxylase superfamily)
MNTFWKEKLIGLALFNIGSILAFYFTSLLLEFICYYFLEHLFISKPKRETAKIRKTPYRKTFIIINSMQIGTFLYLNYEFYYMSITNLHFSSTFSIFTAIFELLLILFLCDTQFYWTHRLGHKSIFLLIYR